MSLNKTYISSTQVASSTPFDPTGIPYVSTDVQSALTELRDETVLNFQTTATTASGTLILAAYPTNYTAQFLTGSATGFTVQLPNATTLFNGTLYTIYNTSSKSVTINDGSGAFLTTLISNSTGFIILKSNATTAGTWIVTVISNGTAPSIKSSSVPASYFSGNPKEYAVTFTLPFVDANYAINITGTDNRTFTWQSKTSSGFTIVANSKTTLTGNVDWTAVYITQTAAVPPPISGSPIGLLLALTNA